MATYLFNDISDFKNYVGGGANVSLKMATLDPAILAAAENHIILWLGQGQWDQLVTAVAGTPTTEEEALIPYVARPLAMLAMYEYEQIGGIQIGEAGFHRIEDDTRRSAYKYQENNYSDWMLNNGYENIERMLKFLEANEANYPLWQADPAYQRNKALFLNYAAEFRAAYSKYISRYTFEILRPLLEDIETFALVTLMGQTLFDALKDGLLLKALSTKESILVEHIQRALANFAIEEGIRRHWVRLDGKKVVQSERLEPQSSEKQGLPPMPIADMALRHNELFANRHISYIKKYLEDNIDDFPDYQTYLDELAEAEAAATVEQTACDERLECGCLGYCGCCADTNVKGFVSL